MDGKYTHLNIKTLTEYIERCFGGKAAI